ncbi:hypothetical protein BofuT4_uP056970.1 [Botrytis cinerea T4]|uniref:Uncharacterized protein n=1 Tax=Botryotinia fuckeliana (strain T4) TaxID=999810 RepID=G2XWC6_BOTF4|nr:hypothetical protein BofuT4_uP056970.1 [Botrytis cinerea T4]
MLLVWRDGAKIFSKLAYICVIIADIHTRLRPLSDNTPSDIELHCRALRRNGEESRRSRYDWVIL